MAVHQVFGGPADSLLSDECLFGFKLSNHHRHVLLALGLNGPNTKTKLRLEINSENLPRGDSHLLGKRLHIEQARRAVNQLKDLKMVTESEDSFLIWLTFPGVIWFLRYKGAEENEQTFVKKRIIEFLTAYEKFAKSKSSRYREIAAQTYEKVIPFCSLWKKIPKDLSDKFVERLASTVSNFYLLDKGVVQNKCLDLPLEVYVKDSGDKCSQCRLTYTLLEKDDGVEKFLRTEAATMLRESYLACLFSEDLIGLSGLSDEKTLEKLPKLKSVTEALSFGFIKSPSELFTHEFLKFFAKYAGVEYFFTGIFVDNWLWDKKSYN
ncbi:MAG: hypothetical protein NWF01_05780 [Candidatus Bathyarchaeota archaeon]|nr:hypothetical protein [Candidatus Bathyarchaeota archaeon]